MEEEKKIDEDELVETSPFLKISDVRNKTRAKNLRLKENDIIVAIDGEEFHGNRSELLKTLADAGYNMEDDEYSPNTVCVEFPVHEPYFQKGKRSVSMWEQLEMAAQYQHYWADNSVSITVTFKPEEASQLKDALEMYETRLKAVSFLKYEETGYAQAPYEPIAKETYEKLIKGIKPIQRFDSGEGGSGTKFCTNDSCTI